MVFDACTGDMHSHIGQTVAQLLWGYAGVIEINRNHIAVETDGNRKNTIACPVDLLPDALQVMHSVRGGNGEIGTGF